MGDKTPKKRGAQVEAPHSTPQARGTACIAEYNGDHRYVGLIPHYDNSANSRQHVELTLLEISGL